MIYSCKVCNYETTIRLVFDNHIKTVKHRRNNGEKAEYKPREPNLKTSYECEPCGFKTYQHSNMMMHTKTFKHIKNTN